MCGVGCGFLEFGFRRIILLPAKAATGISGYRRSQNIECSVLQCVAVCCSVLQCVAVCCSVDIGRCCYDIERGV